MKQILITLAVVLILSGGVVGYRAYAQAPQGEKGAVCASDTIICPDGSILGRIGAQCLFSKCPKRTTPSELTAKAATISSGRLSGTMTLAPACSVERVNNPCRPTPEMYAARKISVYMADKKTLITTLSLGIEF